MKLLKKENKGEGYIGPNRVLQIIAVGSAVIVIIAYATNNFEPVWPEPSIFIGPSVFSLKSAALLLLFCGSLSYIIDEKGVTVYRFGIETRQVPWSSIKQAGIGYSEEGPAIIMTLEGGKEFTLRKESGKKRDVDLFKALHPKTCIVIDANMIYKARPLVERYYGDLDFEWLPPNTEC